MALALERHATSKLPDEAIENVVTLGFRGEALPSIASVARLTLESRVRGADGWRRVVDNGAVTEEGPAALPPGTRVRVEGLFDRVPARRKFLRSPRAEYGASLDVVRRLAMARPDIAFSVEHGKQLLTYLRLTKQPLGLLINFGGETLKEGLRRVVNDYRPFAPSRLRVNQNNGES